ncbi:MAG: hydrogenase maturation protease [Acidobacteria bacterium]|nr:hydrogenase maturation protease [Acidobacteriota bacterium]
MTSVVIIGYGNALRGDDAAGRLAAEALSEKLNRSDVVVFAVHQLGPELAESISAFDVALFIDATQRGQAGELHCDELEPHLDDSSLTHSASPEALLMLAHELYGRAPRAYLFSLSGESFELEERLSPSVARALPRLVELVNCVAARTAAQCA